jgi:hypothetical protein
MSDLCRYINRSGSPQRGVEELFGSWIVVLEEENSTVMLVCDALGAEAKEHWGIK